MMKEPKEDDAFLLHALPAAGQSRDDDSPSQYATPCFLA